MKENSPMTKFRLAHLGLVMAAIGFTAAAPLAGFSSVAYAAETVRAEIGKPLQEAQKLAAAGKNKEALAKLKETDAVGGKTANETYLIERTRASAAVLPAITTPPPRPSNRSSIPASCRLPNRQIPKPWPASTTAPRTTTKPSPGSSAC
jgi:hypothetical protein